jgi:hypothetical protein
MKNKYVIEKMGNEDFRVYCQHTRNPRLFVCATPREDIAKLIVFALSEIDSNRGINWTAL